MDKLEQAKVALLNHQVIALPTDTVWGLAASLQSTTAIQEIFALKGRSADVPLVVMVAKTEDVIPFCQPLPEKFFRLASTYWPGALTLVVDCKSHTVPDLVHAGRNTLGFRIPNCAPLLALLKETGPLVVTSCNKSGQSPVQSAKEASTLFPDIFVWDFLQPLSQTASTVASVSSAGEICILRQGIIHFN